MKNLRNSAGDSNYEELANFTLRALSLPISNFFVERVFSIMATVKTKLRNRMSFSMLVAIMRICIHLHVLNKYGMKFKPSKTMIELFNSSMYKTVFSGS